MKIALAASLAMASTALVAQSVPQPNSGAPETAPAFNLAEGKAAVERLAAILERDFLNPDAGRAYAAMLRANLGSGAYDKHKDARSFAEAVTADIQAVHPDGHLTLQPPPYARPAPQAGSAASAPRPTPQPGIQKAAWIAPGIAYISFSDFLGDPAMLEKLRAFLGAHRDAKTLIIDARVHRGGGLDEMDILFPVIFGSTQTLVHMDTRRAVEEAGRGVLQDGATLRRIAGPDEIIRREHIVLPAPDATPLRTAKVYLLTSPRTGSAGEHLSLALKRTGRATLIGETTAGAGNFGDMHDLGGGYRAFVPIGGTFDPVTGKGWEGTGVQPDVDVSAERALYEALVRAGVSPQEAERLSAAYRPVGPMDRRIKLRN
ncbi:S41 family peptidase [Allosphingosinicella vermicomposti]|uniref:S41 family peptidase n=1 Tax=Allosphingosinicella vermicomposti TaxID=614671 RepID=UPI00131A564A|nr:S41 family peptidase [Allosphingosinicella vermicomposti]